MRGALELSSVRILSPAKVEELARVLSPCPVEMKKEAVHGADPGPCVDEGQSCPWC